MIRGDACAVDGLSRRCHETLFFCTHPSGPRYGAASKTGSLRICGDSPQAPPPQPRPVTEWPLTARILAKLRAESDAGLGDTIHRHLARFGADAMKRFYKRITGSDCGCANRQDKINRMFPYDKSGTRTA